MFKKKIVFSFKLGLLAIFSMIFIFPIQAPFAQDTNSVSITKDVILGYPIQSADEMPDLISFSLYESDKATIPLATQEFSRGDYSIDFDFSKSDGLSSGTVARLTVDFDEKLNLDNATDSLGEPKEIWAELSIQGEVVGDRKKISDEAMVKLLLASDASIATYLTLAYKGDDNPITTIYRDLPISSSTELGTASSLSDYFSGLVSASGETVLTDATRADYWMAGSGTSIYYDHNVGIADTAPNRALSVKYSSTSGSLDSLPTVSVVNTHESSGGTSDYSFASFEFAANNGDTVGEFFVDGSGLFTGGTPNVYFRAGPNTAMLLGTNKTSRVAITTTGNVGIGTLNPSYNLAVNGSIGCQSLTVTTSGWSDFVFEPDYKLPTLSEVETYISQNKHLPDIPSEAEVMEQGISVGEMSSKLLQKIEELTLYVIDLKKENEVLKGQLVEIREHVGSRTE